MLKDSVKILLVLLVLSICSASSFALPTIGLVQPPNMTTSAVLNTFACNISGVNITNITFKIWNTYQANQTVNVSGNYSIQYWNVSFPVTSDVYQWTCWGYDATGIGYAPNYTLTLISYEHRSTCDNTSQTLFAGFALIAIALIVGAAFLIITIMGGNIELDFQTMTLGLIGTAIVVMVGVFITGTLAGIVCNNSAFDILIPLTAPAVGPPVIVPPIVPP